MKKIPLLVATALLLGGCNATMSDLKKKASENPVMAVAAGVAVGVAAVATGGASLAVMGAAGVGVSQIYDYESGLQAEVDKMSCGEAKELARRNYYGPNQKKELLDKACASQRKVSKK